MTPSDLALTTMEVKEAHDDRDRARILARALGREDDYDARELLQRAMEASWSAGRRHGFRAAQDFYDIDDDCDGVDE